MEAELVPSRAVRENPFLASVVGSRGGCLHVHVAFSPRASLAPDFPFFTRTWSFGLGPNLVTSFYLGKYPVSK